MSDDQGMDVSPSWQELRDERDRALAEVERLKKAIKRQAGAAKTGMDAAKAVGAHMQAEAKRLFAECNPDALDGERQANAQLTEEVERLRKDNDDLRQEVVAYRGG